MKKPVNPSKVIIIPQTPQNNNMETEVPKANNPVETQAPPTTAPQQAEAEVAEEEGE